MPKPTHTRIEEWLKSHELKYIYDDDGDLAVGFEEVNIFIGIDSEYDRVHTHGYWRGGLATDEAKARAVALANELNSSMVAPKVLVNLDQGRIITETVSTHPFGITDQQLEFFLDMSFQTTMAAIGKLEEALPDLIEGDNA
nr:YbjN domain-containing protein [Corynebacterium mendelii]